jgi:hypothetical protein
MYLRFLKTTVKEALEQTFDGEYPNTRFRNVHCSVEYPIDVQEYPSIWVDYEDSASLAIAGIDHTEFNPDGHGGFVPSTRWRFQGYISLTLVALTSQERDDLYDEVVRVMAFGRQSPATAQFRTYIENNDFIACNFDFDQIEPKGSVAAPGTPWGTDELIYERGLNMEVIGEIVVDDATGALLPLSGVTFTATEVDEGPLVEVPIVGPGGPSDWH